MWCMLENDERLSDLVVELTAIADDIQAGAPRALVYPLFAAAITVATFMERRLSIATLRALFEVSHSS